MDWADHNLDMFESVSDVDPVKAKELFEAAKALNSILNKEMDK